MEMQDRYPKQFIVSYNAIDPITSWSHEIICGFHLNRSTVLPRTIIYRAEIQIGFILGWFVYKNTFYFRDDSIHIEAIDFDIFYEKISGRFLIFEKKGLDLQVTTDPGGLLSIVYHENLRIAASTTNAISAIKMVELDENIIKNVTRIDKTIWFPFGIVPYENTKRILPGHKLLLGTGKITRINYLKKQTSAEKPDEVTREIFNLVLANIIAVSKAGPLTSHLTAGYDSRMILSSCLRSGVDINFITFLTDSLGSRLDCEVAKHIATKFNLNHKIILFEQPDEVQIENWLERTDHCIYDSVVLLCKTVKESDNGNFVLTGGCGEVGRSFYWKKNDLFEKNITTKELINILGFKPSKLLSNRCKKWLDELPENFDKTEILDLAYIENRLGCWGGPSVYGHDIEKPTISPFNEAFIYKKMLSLPKEYRLKNEFAKKFIALSDKKLLKIPFNRAIGFRKFLYLKQEIKNMLPKEKYELTKQIFFIIKSHLTKM